MKENPKFYLSSFNGTITTQMNPEMSVELYILIQGQSKVGKELFAMSEKIRTQLFHMKRIGDLENALRTSVSVHAAEGRQGNTGTSPIGVIVPGPGELVDVGASPAAAA